MQGNYKVAAIIPVEGTEDEIMGRAASVGYLADFSVAEALVDEAKSRGLSSLSASKFESLPGKGAKALIDNMEVRVGSPKFLIEERIAVPVSFAEKITSLTRAGEMVIVVLSGRSLSGAVVLSKIAEQKVITLKRMSGKSTLRVSTVWRVAIIVTLCVATLLLIYR